MATRRQVLGDIYYEVRGTGLPIVLGHSFLCSGEMWNPQLEALSKNHQVLNLDLRGHGRSAPVTESVNASIVSFLRKRFAHNPPPTDREPVPASTGP